MMTPVLFGLVHVVDSYCVEDVFDEPWYGVVVGCVISMIALIPFPYLAPFIQWDSLSGSIILSGFVAGLLIQFSQLLYFYALDFSEPGIVAAYWNFVPALLPFAAFYILSELLTVRSYVGIGILVVSSICFCLLDSKPETKIFAFILMVIASIAQIVMFLLEKIVYSTISFLDGYYIILSGLLVGGLTPLLFKQSRGKIRDSKKGLLSFWKVFVVVELLNLLALLSSQLAVYLGSPSLVAAVESMIPAYAFLFTAAWFYFSKNKNISDAINYLFAKIVLVFAMGVGVVLVS